jgi:succinoglycan biosynthesis transport protein ExoP
MNVKRHLGYLNAALKILRRRKYPALAAFVVPLIAVAIYILTAPAKYEATGKVILETSISQQGLGLTPQPFSKSNEIANETERIKSHEVIDNAVILAATMDEADLAGQPPTASELTRDLSVSNLENTDILDISIVSYDSRRAAALVNLIMDSYIDVHLSSSRDEARSVREFIGEQVSEYEKRLAESENAIEDFKKESGTVSLQEETDLLVRNLADYDRKTEENGIERAGEYKRLKFLEAELQEIQSELKENPVRASSPLAEELQKQVITLEYRYSTLILKGYPPEHEEMVALAQEIDTARRQLSEELDVLFEGKSPVNPFDEIRDIGVEMALVRANIAELEAEASSIEAAKEQAENDLKVLPKHELTMARLVREKKANEEIYLMLLEKREEARIAEAEVAGNARIFSRAKPPDHQISPNKKQSIFLAFLTGLFFVGGVVFLLEYLDKTIRTPGSFKSALSAPVLGVIPLEPKPRGPAALKGINNPLKALGGNNGGNGLNAAVAPVMFRSPHGTIADSYRGLRVRFQHKTNGQNAGGNIVIVTAASPREGKTTVSINLAIALAQIGKKVCLIDGDTIKPSVADVLGLEAVYGYSDLLLDKTTIENVLMNDIIPGLSVIPGFARSSENGELTGNGSFGALIGELRRYGFEHIILDFPPLLSTADAFSIAEHVDGYLLISRSGVVDPSTVAYCEELINQVGSTVIGGVLTCVDPGDLHVGYSHYYYYQYYYKSSPGMEVIEPKGKRSKLSRANSRRAKDDTSAK